ncbi:MAG TPA: methionine--tRNA ligase [Candidatus Saccharimonadales bacterium]|nr:methionine--tRNA ligase [Candidatus Saccharimonadales bacterium]
MAKFYITNAIPYVNAKPHIGHALEFVQSDTVARYHKLLGDDVLLLCGGDENAIKNVQAAEKAGEPVQEFVDKNNVLFEELTKALNVDFDIWQKGSSKQHFEASQELWKRCAANGDIYKKSYTGLYCVGCELFYEKDELNENGECFEHPGKKLEEVSEENYFFKLSKYQEQLEELFLSDTIKIIPSYRKNEMLSFLKQGLKDISISRSNERAKNWGVPVPEDDSQRMYVWFDALNIYQSGIGFPDSETYKKWWPADVQMIGKGILRFHAIYWPAFLLSAKLELPKSIFVHGYLTVDGQKMSKTLGNVVDPIEMINKYGADAVRYYLLKEVSSTGDGDFSEEKLKEVYNADLANGLGNLVARVAKLCEKNEIDFSETPRPTIEIASSLKQAGYHEHLKQFEFNITLEEIWREIKTIDVRISNDKPWLDSGESVKQNLREYVRQILNITYSLKPFLPETTEKIMKQFKGQKITSGNSLFPRLV